VDVSFWDEEVARGLEHPAYWRHVGYWVGTYDALVQDTKYRWGSDFDGRVAYSRGVTSGKARREEIERKGNSVEDSAAALWTVLRKHYPMTFREAS
jgi:hypothetical protein